MVLLSALPARAETPALLLVNRENPGRTYEGIGALSAGASTRLLPDYPEPYRSQILDYLFKPRYGASLNHLKVEIGGDVNSTCGTEPSHRRTRDERPDFTRGYEWWLMREAKRRNPSIALDVLQWGAPGWIGGGRFYSQDNADFVAEFIRGADSIHGLKIDYAGIWNETPYDPEYIKTLASTFRREGLSTKIVAADEVCAWTVADRMREDAALMDAAADGGKDSRPVQPEPPDVEKPPVSGTVVIVSEGGKVNIREGNGLTYGRITQLAPGTICPYVATAENGWHAVAVGKRVGWVSPEYSRVI